MRTSEQIMEVINDFIKEARGRGYSQARINDTYRFRTLEEEYLEALDYEHDVKEQIDEIRKRRNQLTK